MICPNCKTAGAILRGCPAGKIPDEGLLVYLHERCPGGTWCDCAHDTVSRLNLGLIREQEQPVKGVVE